MEAKNEANEAKDESIHLDTREQSNLLDDITQLEIDIESNCPITTEPFKFPAISIYGHIYEKEYIEAWVNNKKNCPLTRQPLEQKDLYSFDYLNEFIQKTNEELKQFKVKASELKSEDRILQFKKDLKTFKELYLNARKKLLTKLQIIINLKLDNKNSHDLTFWQNQVSLGGTSITLKETTYKVPARIFRMMHAVKDNFASKEALFAALDAIRLAKEKNQTYSWADYRLFSFLRSSTTKKVYSEENIEKLKI